MKLSLLTGVAVGMAGVAFASDSTQLSTNPNPVTLRSYTGSPIAPNTPSTDTLTQSVTQTITPANSVSCNAAGLHTDNWYYRVFDTSAFASGFEVQSVEFAVETAVSASTMGQPVRVRVYDSADLADTLIDANIVFDSGLVNVADQTAAIQSVAASGTVLSGSMIIEIFTPEGQTAGDSFFIGSNPDGQTAPCFIRADACGIAAPTDLAAIGFPTMHIVMNVLGKPASAGGPLGADECANADVIGPGATVVAFDTNVASDTGLPATNSAEVGNCGSISDDVWFSWTANVSGEHIFSTCDDADFDTEIGLWEGTDCGTAIPVACNDDGTGCSGFTSELVVPGIVAGTTYLVQIGHFNSTSGDVFGMGNLTITEPGAPPANDTCNTPEMIMGLGDFPYDSTFATSSGFDGGGGCAIPNQDVFFEWTAPMIPGDYFVSTCLTGYDTILAVHSGSGCAATCFGSNDDDLGAGGAGVCGGGLQSSVALMGLAGGETFLIQVGGFGANEGPGTLTISGPMLPGDDCSNPVDIGNMTGIFNYDTTGYGSSGFDGNGGCTDAIGQDIFLTWTAPNDGAFEFNTCMTGYDTRISVHDGMDCAATCIATNDDSCGLQSTVSATLVTGQTVLLQLGGFGTNEGPAVLEILEFIDPCNVPDDALEENDDCTMAVAVGEGKVGDLFVSDVDEDWYAITVPAFTTAFMQILFVDDDGDMDMFLFDACGGTELDRGFSASDNEQVTFDNSAGNTAVTVFLQVNGFVTGGFECNNYTLVVSFENGQAGFAYCAGTPNSSGFIANMSSSGSSSVSGNDLTLVSGPVPNNVFGIFFHGPEQAQIPFQRQDALCRQPGPSFGRHAGGRLDALLGDRQHHDPGNPAGLPPLLPGVVPR